MNNAQKKVERERMAAELRKGIASYVAAFEEAYRLGSSDRDNAEEYLDDAQTYSDRAAELKRHLAWLERKGPRR